MFCTFVYFFKAFDKVLVSQKQNRVVQKCFVKLFFTFWLNVLTWLIGVFSLLFTWDVSNPFHFWFSFWQIHDWFAHIKASSHCFCGRLCCDHLGVMKKRQGLRWEVWFLSADWFRIVQVQDLDGFFLKRQVLLVACCQAVSLLNVMLNFSGVSEHETTCNNIAKRLDFSLVLRAGLLRCVALTSTL